MRASVRNMRHVWNLRHNGMWTLELYKTGTSVYADKYNVVTIKTCYHKHETSSPVDNAYSA